MKKRFCLLIALLLSLCLGLSCAAEQIFDSTPFALEAEEQLELIDQYQLVPSVLLAEEARLNVLEDAELVLGEEPTDEKTILDTGAVLTLEDRAVINVYGDLYGWIADIAMGEDSEINIFLSAGARMAALLPEELVEPEKLEELENSFTYYGLNIIGLDDPGSIAVFDADGNRIIFGHGDKTDSIVHPGERYTVQFRTGLNKGRRLSFVLDPSKPLNLNELLAQNPIKAYVSLEAAEATEADAEISFTVTLSRAARRSATVTLTVGETDYTIDIPKGSTSGTISVPNPCTDDPYVGESTLTASVTGFSGGGFDRVYYSDASAAATIADVETTTIVTLSATDGKEGDQYIRFVVELDNAARTAATATVTANDTPYTVNIPAGKSSATLDVPNPNTEDVYLDASTLTASVTGFTGGDFEKVDFSKASATATIADTIDTTTVSLSAADGKEGDANITFTATLSNAARTAATVTLTVGETQYTIDIAPDATSGSVDVPNPYADDAYTGERTLTGSVTGFTGGDFEKVDFSKASATATIADTIDTTTVSLSAADGKEGDANIRFTVSLDNAARTAASVTLNVGSKDYTIDIAAGATSRTIDVPNPYADDAYTGARTLTATVTAVSGGEFEKVDFSKASATATIADVETTTKVSISTNDITRDDANITFTVTLSNPAQTDASVSVDAGGSPYFVEIPAGATSATLTVPNPRKTDDSVKSLTATVSDFGSGGFEKVDFSGATATARILYTTNVTLSTSDIYEGQPSINFTITLTSAPTSRMVFGVRTNNVDRTLAINAGETSATLTVDNANGEDIYLDASTMTAEITSYTGGIFDAVYFDCDTVTANIMDTIDVTTVSLSTNDVKESASTIPFTVTLSNAPQTNVAVLLNVGGTDYTVNIAAGYTSGSINVPNPNGEDPYIDESRLTGRVTSVSGGNFESVDYSSATATAKISDTIDTTKVSLSARDYLETDANTTFTVTLSNPAQSDTVVKVNVGGANYDVYIAPGATSGSVSVPTNGAASLTGEVTGLTGANFEAADYSSTTVTARCIVFATYQPGSAQSPLSN